MLVDCLRRERLGPGVEVLDLCTGSGVLAVAAALTGAHVLAVDLSRRALLSARLNARVNGVGVQTRRSNLFSALPGERFDVIVCNPPYLPSPNPPPSRGLARAWDAGPRGRLLIDPICERAGEHLNPGGVLLLLHSSLCGEQKTLTALRRHGLDAEVAFRHRGPLGEILSGRAEWMQDQGLLADEAQEDIVVFRARRPPVAALAGGPVVSKR
jgi:release factor glutamine methyltransferase